MRCFRPLGRAWHLIYKTVLVIFLKCSVLAEAYFAGKGLKEQCQLNGKGNHLSEVRRKTLVLLRMTAECVGWMSLGRKREFGDHVALQDLFKINSYQNRITSSALQFVQLHVQILLPPTLRLHLLCFRCFSMCKVCLKSLSTDFLCLEVERVDTCICFSRVAV